MCGRLYKHLKERKMNKLPRRIPPERVLAFHRRGQSYWCTRCHRWVNFVKNVDCEPDGTRQLHCSRCGATVALINHDGWILFLQAVEEESGE